MKFPDKPQSLPTVVDDGDEAPPMTAADMARAVRQVNLQPMPRKQKISITLDPDIVTFFKAQAGERLSDLHQRHPPRGDATADAGNPAAENHSRKTTSGLNQHKPLWNPPGTALDGSDP